MKKEIRKLVEQADFCFWGDESWNPGEPGDIDWSSDYTKELNTLCELLVQRCADICYNLRFTPEGPTEGIEWQRSLCGDAIKEHFKL